MRTGPRDSELAGPPVDWMAEFTDEDKHELPLLSALDKGVSDHEGVQEPRLISLPKFEPPAYWDPQPHRPRPSHEHLPKPTFILVGIAIVAMFAGLMGAAVLWNRTLRLVDRADLLSRAPTPLPTEPSPPEPATKLMQPPIVPPPQPAGTKVSQKSPASAKPQPLIRGAIDRQRVAPPRASTPTPTAAPTPTLTPSPTPTPTPTPTSLPLAATPPPATTVVTPPVATLGTALPARPAADTTSPPPPTARDERAIHTAAIQSVLDRYRLAFNTLSVDGLATVWRSVDTKALARAFDQLEKQAVEFDACQIEIAGELAEASCRGRVSFVPKVGARTPRVQSRQWSFRLVRVRAGWVIDRVESR